MCWPAGRAAIAPAVISTILAAFSAPTAKALDWPVGNGTTNQAIYSTYGQYYEGTGGGLHFHEGVDIAVARGTPVIAREAGVVVSVNTDAGTPENSNLIMRTGAVGTVGQNYVHLVPGNRPAGNNGVGDPGGPWAAGDTIKVGDALGAVAAFSAGNHPDHLHMDRGAGVDPYGGAANINYPQQNVLSIYSPNTSAGDPTPVLSLPFQYRRADQDRLGDAVGGGAMPAQLGNEQERTDNLYFQKVSCTYKVIGRMPGLAAATTAFDGSTGAGSGDIDIVANAYDQAAPAQQYHNGIYSMAFKIQGQHWNDGTANDGTGNGPGDLKEVYLFNGQFLDDGTATKHQYSALRSTNLTRVVYSNDRTTNSSDNANGNPGTYWYNVTNSDGDTIVDANDRNRYWNSDVVRPAASGGGTWNNIAAADAPNNAKGAFRDDIYSVNVIARDVRGGIASSVESVILDNWKQSITLGGTTFQDNQDIYLQAAAQFSGNDNVPLFLMGAAPADCGTLTSLANPFASFFGTDDSGSLGDPELLGELPDGNYWLVADYNHDGMYIPELDAVASFSVVPEPSTELLMALGIPVFVWRQRKCRRLNIARFAALNRLSQTPPTP
jgi:hypothetical protein